MTSWDEKGTVKIQYELEKEIVAFIKEVGLVSALSDLVLCLSYSYDLTPHFPITSVSCCNRSLQK